MNNILLIIILVLIVLIILYVLYKHKFKNLKLDALTMVNGGVKSGKTTLQVILAIKDYKKRKFKWKIQKIFCKVLRKNPPEEPLLYSNIKLRNIPYVELTEDLIMRRKRFNYKSVLLISESSLMIDSMSYKDNDLNERVTLFVKLWGHETHGGSCYIETQAINDNHFAFKRCLNKYIWIHSLTKNIPFVLVFRVRELMYSEDVSTNSFNEDIEETTKLLIFSKKWWKYFDCYTYSVFTDSLESVTETIENSKHDDLKTSQVISFKKYDTLYENLKGDDTNENEKKS